MNSIQGIRWSLIQSKLAIKTSRFIKLTLIILFFTGSPLFAIPSSTDISSNNVQQQEKIISGNVTDESGVTLIGVTVIVQGTTIGTITDENGDFSFSVPDDAEMLSVSFIGMETQELSIGNQTNFNIVMIESTTALQEVVVIGYGTQQRRDLTGSVSSINEDVIQNMTTASIDQKMVGQIPGVRIQQVTGAPGGGTSVKIRGSGSLGAGNEPLYVIDGMPYSANMNHYLNPLTFIDPNTIESISVLKDASSTAIYGSRGSNGVIMITTKKGSYGKTQINVSVKTGLQEVPQRGRLNMMNAREFADYQREFIGNRLRIAEGREPVEADFPVEYRDAYLNQIGEGTNWYDEMLQVAPIQDYSINVAKGTQDSRMNFSLGYYNHEGVLKYTGIERYSAKLSAESNVGKLKVFGSLTSSFIDQKRAGQYGYGEVGMLASAGYGNPVMPAYDENGELIPWIQSPTNKYKSAANFANPVFELRETIGHQKEIQNFGSAFLEYTIIPDLKIKTSLNTILSSSNYYQYRPSTIGGRKAPVPGTGRASSNKSSDINWLIENTLTYGKSFNEHRFDAILGYTTQKYSSNGTNITAYPFPNDQIQTINAADQISVWGQSTNEWSLISYLGRINYAFRDRYLLTATFRSDGSSRFGKNNKYVFFPSMAAAWIVSDEDFFNVNMIDNMKLRLSYGKSGNNNIGNYSALSTISSQSYIIDGAMVPASYVGISNPNLTWEESYQIDAGLDLALFDNRLSFILDYYYRMSENMLLNDLIPGITGFTSQTINKGNVRNAGIELLIDATPISGEFSWNTNLNIAVNRNEVISTNAADDPILSGFLFGIPTHISQVGKPIGQLYGLVNIGIMSAEDMANPEVAKTPQSYEGSNKYKDVDGDGMITGVLDYEILGDPHPDFTFGITNSFRYMGFDLTVVVYGQYGGLIIDGMHATTDNLSGVNNLRKEWVNRWRSPEDPGDGKHAGIGPTEGWAWKMSSWWVEEASFLKISNLTLGYSLPQKWMTSIGFIQSCNPFITVQNLATFTKYHGANPEGQAPGNNTLIPGYDYTSYPPARVYSLGVNLLF